MSAPAPWPDSLFAAPILRSLDEAGRRAVEGAGRMRRVEAGRRIFAVDELGDSFFVIDRGEVELWGRSGAAADAQLSDELALLRTARAGETFGEESALP